MADKPDWLKKKIKGADEDEDETSEDEEGGKKKKGGAENPLMAWAKKRGKR